MKQFYKLCSVCLFFIIFICFYSLILKASSPVVEITPSRFELLAEPRERSIQSIKIRNLGEESLTIQVTARDWNMDGNGSLILLDSVSTENSASDWLRFNPRRFTIPPGETQIVRFAVTVPPKVEAGEYLTSLVLVTEEKFALKENLYYQPTFAILLYVNIPEIKRVGELGEAKLKIDEEGNYYINGNILSKGNAHLRTVGEYYIEDINGEILTCEPIEKKVILPERSESYQIFLGKDLQAGEYKMNISWQFIPAFYMKGSMAEYPEGEKLIQEFKFTIK